jgi:hypothetical protein
MDVGEIILPILWNSKEDIKLEELGLGCNKKIEDYNTRDITFYTINVLAPSEEFYDHGKRNMTIIYSNGETFTAKEEIDTIKDKIKQNLKQTIL